MPGKKARVLVIEDEMLISIEIQSTLLAAGYGVISGISSLELAIDAAAEAEIDIALVDINLVGLLAMPAIRALRARGIPFALVTAYAKHELPGDLGAEMWLEKPFGEEALLAAVAELARRSRLRS
jgi:DNA-binding response OmpR family regulator